MPTQWEELRKELGTLFEATLRLDSDEVVSPGVHEFLGRPFNEALRAVIAKARDGATRNTDKLTKDELIEITRLYRRFHALVRNITETPTTRNPAEREARSQRARSMVASLHDDFVGGPSNLRKEEDSEPASNIARQATPERVEASAPQQALVPELQAALEVAKKRLDLFEEQLRAVTPESIRQVQERMETQSARLDELQSATARAAEVAGITKHAREFESEANAHEVEASKWLTRTTVLAAATVLTGVLFVSIYAFVSPPTDVWSIVQIAGVKLVTFSVLVSATIWAGSNYRAHKHNVVTNRHRQNALATFQAFVGVTEDETTKNAILLAATNCIFGMQSSGYAVANDTSETKTRVLEILRSGPIEE